MGDLRAWSLSALASFETCPKKYHAVSVAKAFREEEGEAARHGKRVHKAFEEFLGPSAKPFPPDLSRMEEVARKTVPDMEHRVIVEHKIALNRNLMPVSYFDKDVFLRVVVDYAAIMGPVAMLLDWKTGKPHEDYDQLDLMAAAMFRTTPHLEHIVSSYVWLQPGVPPSRKKYVRADEPHLWNRFAPRVAVFEDAFRKDEFPARPNGLCRKYCPVRTCPHNG